MVKQLEYMALCSQLRLNKCRVDRLNATWLGGMCFHSQTLGCVSHSSAVSLGPINPLPGDLSDLSFLGIGLGMQLIFANIIRFL